MHNILAVTWRQTTEGFAFGAVGMLLVAVLLGGTQYRRLSSGVRFFWFYLVMVLIIEVLAKYHHYILDTSNMYLLHIYTFFEFVLLMLFFRETLELRVSWRRTLLGITFSIGIVLVLYSANILFWHNEKLLPQHFQLYSKIITNFFILFFSVLFFVRFISGRIKKESRVLFWIYAGILTYFSGSFVIFMAINQLIRMPLKESIVLWLLNAVLAFVFYGIVNTAFLIQRQNWKRLRPG